MARPANGGRLTCESCVAIVVREWKRRACAPVRCFPCLETEQAFPAEAFLFILNPTRSS